MSFVDDFNAFLIEHSGTTGYAIAKMLSEEPEESGPVFFQPYTSIGNFFKRAAYVATAPIFLSILAAESILRTLISTLDAIFGLLTGDTSAKEKGEDVLFGCILSACAILFALASPFINAIDLVGSLFAKSTDENQEEYRSEYTPS